PRFWKAFPNPMKSRPFADPSAPSLAPAKEMSRNNELRQTTVSKVMLRSPPTVPWVVGQSEIGRSCRRSVVGQSEILFLYVPRLSAFGSMASQSATISETSQNRSVTPAAIAGDVKLNIYVKSESLGLGLSSARKAE
ncbi:MAG TPA: hypothetical protein VGG66_10265, partial [Rhizomicrobium sp.]